EPLPGQSTVRAPQCVEPRGNARDRARRGADRVVDQLLAERDVEMHELGCPRRRAEAGNGDEEVELARTPAARVPIDPVAAAEQPALIHARELTKRFGELVAVDAVDFDVAAGEAFGFLGPNGAGKSSTMRMIGCVSPRTSGTLQILGMDPDADGARIRARLG